MRMPLFRNLTLQGIGASMFRVSCALLGTGFSNDSISPTRMPFAGSNEGGRSKVPPREVW